MNVLESSRTTAKENRFFGSLALEKTDRNVFSLSLGGLRTILQGFCTSSEEICTSMDLFQHSDHAPEHFRTSEQLHSRLRFLSIQFQLPSKCDQNGHTAYNNSKEMGNTDWICRISSHWCLPQLKCWFHPCRQWNSCWSSPQLTQNTHFHLK